jgi:hypothetical protein
MSLDPNEPVALWRYVDAGVVIEGAVLKDAAKAN